MITFFFTVYSLIRKKGREKFCVCRGGGEILSGDNSIEAQGWDIIRMD